MTRQGLTTTLERPIRVIYVGDEGHDAYICSIDDLYSDGLLDAVQVPDVLLALAQRGQYTDETDGYEAHYDTQSHYVIIRYLEQRGLWAPSLLNQPS